MVETTALLILFLMTFMGNSMVPLPISPYIIWLGQFHFPLTVIVVATIGSMTGWIVLEKFLHRMLTGKPQLLTRIPQAYQAFFLKNTGLSLFFFNALPLPMDPVRFLAMTTRYPRERFLAILAVARLIRYTSLVSMGALLAEYTLWFWGILLFFLLLPLLFYRPNQQADETTEAPEPQLTQAG